MDDRQPSVLELLACDGLKQGLREGLKYLLNNIYQIDGLRFLSSNKSFKTDEAILLLDLLIEYNYLRTYNASYAEHLYNLIRSSSRNNKLEIDKRILPSLICLTLVPYLKRKLDNYFEELNYKPIRTADELIRIRYYRLFSKSCSFLNLICLLRFAAGKSAYHNFLDGMLNIRLMSRNTIIDENSNLNTLTLTLFDKTSKTIADLLGRSLTIGSYVIQFLDYWNTHSNSAPMFNASLPIPAPPRKDLLVHGDEKSSNLCLICLHVRQNECALSNTGYVFCYSCLQRYVTTKQKCPITGHPTKLDNIVKLFTTTTNNSTITS